MKDDLKSKLLYDLTTFDSFRAQIELEDETITSLQSKLLAIDLNKPNVDLDYARVRGSLEALIGLKAKRERFIEDFRSRLRNS